MTLTEFLLARIEEDEQDVVRYEERFKTKVKPYSRGAFSIRQSDLLVDDEYMSIIIPAARVLAQCKAFRRIAESEAASQFCEQDAWWEAACIVASIYSDHPDYDKEWSLDESPS